MRLDTGNASPGHEIDSKTAGIEEAHGCLMSYAEFRDFFHASMASVRVRFGDKRES
jgi:hypothetical protein